MKAVYIGFFLLGCCMQLGAMDNKQENILDNHEKIEIVIDKLTEKQSFTNEKLELGQHWSDKLKTPSIRKSTEKTKKENLNKKNIVEEKKLRRKNSLPIFQIPSVYGSFGKMTPDNYEDSDKSLSKKERELQYRRYLTNLERSRRFIKDDLETVKKGSCSHQDYTAWGVFAQQYGENTQTLWEFLLELRMLRRQVDVLQDDQEHHRREQRVETTVSVCWEVTKFFSVSSFGLVALTALIMVIKL